MKNPHEHINAHTLTFICSEHLATLPLPVAMCSTCTAWICVLIRAYISPGERKPPCTSGKSRTLSFAFSKFALCVCVCWHYHYICTNTSSRRQQTQTWPHGVSLACFAASYSLFRLYSPPHAAPLDSVTVTLAPSAISRRRSLNKSRSLSDLLSIAAGPPGLCVI